MTIAIIGYNRCVKGLGKYLIHIKLNDKISLKVSYLEMHKYI